MAQPEVWQRGPVPGYDAYLMPVAHSFLQVKEDLDQILNTLSALAPDAVWQRPGGVASIGFHVRHIGGATDRLLTYARGEALTPEQIAFARAEGQESGSLGDLVSMTQAALDRALQQLRNTPRDLLLVDRK